MVEANQGLAAVILALVVAEDAMDEAPTVVKVQPPDGMVLRLPDGGLWSVSMHQLAAASEWEGRP